MRRTIRLTASMALAAGLGLAVGSPALAGPRDTPPPGGPAARPDPHPEVIDSHWGDDDTGEDEKASSDGTWDARADHGSLFTLTSSYRVQQAWSRGITGRGVTVAVIDTGVVPVEGLDAPGKVINGPDLSFDSQASNTRYLDGYGHGTHMAAIIAGRDADFDPRTPRPTSFAGVAPDAQLLNMKVGSADGGADVSQVIAALDWVVQHRKDHGMNVRVVNLAYGTQSAQSWLIDPLARAVENAWNHGIVVVAAAGNDGPDASLLMPASDPSIIAVGAVDHNGTDTLADDAVAEFTNGGNALRRPDVLAPGKSVVSLRDRGSYVDTFHPEGLVTGDTSGRYFRGSGTSQATAFAAGEVALLLQARPDLSPDQVKALLRSTADPLRRNASPSMGTGVIDVFEALTARVPRSRFDFTPPALGLGSLEASRGGEHVVDPTDGSVLAGETGVMGSAWQPWQWSARSGRATAWDGGSWNGQVWTGDGWTGDDWNAADWTGTSWNGVAWAEHAWSGSEWLARSWRDGVWEARSWRNDGWEARSWREDSWLARSWRSLP